jgi:hypothetical protein
MNYNKPSFSFLSAKKRILINLYLKENIGKLITQVLCFVWMMKIFIYKGANQVKLENKITHMLIFM